MNDEHSDSGSKPLDGAHLFINYGSEDRDQALWIRDRLISAGAKIWLDRKNIDGGDEWKQEIDSSLRETQAMIAVLTRTSVDPSRRWIRYEHEEAIRLLRPVVPIICQPNDQGEVVQLPDHLHKFHYLKCSQVQDLDLAAVYKLVAKHALRGGRRIFRETPPRETVSWVERRRSKRSPISC